MTDHIGDGNKMVPTGTGDLIEREATISAILHDARLLSRDGIVSIIRALPTAAQDADLEMLHGTLGGITVPSIMHGDNLSITLCTAYDNPDQDADDETGWTPDAISGKESVLSAIKAHYDPALRKLTADRDALKAEKEKLERLRAEIERLRVENERNAEIAIHAIKQGVEWKARAEKAEAELAALKGAMVKPLAWEECDPCYHSWKAPLFGAIAIKQHWKGHWCVVWSTPGYTELFVSGQFGSLDDAKAAAEARIRAALTTMPLPLPPEEQER